MSDLISRSALIEYLKKVTVTEGITFETGFKQILTDIKNQPTVEARPVVHGKWGLEVTKEQNYHWNVNAECNSCCYENKEVWGGFFPNVPDELARDTALLYAKEVNLPNFCPNCGADMRGGKNA